MKWGKKLLTTLSDNDCFLTHAPPPPPPSNIFLNIYFLDTFIIKVYLMKMELNIDAWPTHWVTHLCLRQKDIDNKDSPMKVLISVYSVAYKN